MFHRKPVRNAVEIVTKNPALQGVSLFLFALLSEKE